VMEEEVLRRPARTAMPNRSKNPVNEWMQGYFSQAFPCLPGFCYGERVGRHKMGHLQLLQ